MHPSRGKGKGAAFLREHINYQSCRCLIWPYFRKPDGYGIFGLNGEIFRAHRWMCEAAHGAPPTPRHEAAHSCGNHSCVNPQHLSWKTSAENKQDLLRHGRERRETGKPRRKITQAQARAIITAKGKRSASDLAIAYGLTERYIRQVWQGVHWPNGEYRKTGLPKGDPRHHWRKNRATAAHSTG